MKTADSNTLRCGCRLENGVLKLCQKHGDSVSRTMAQAEYENDESGLG